MHLVRLAAAAAASLMVFGMTAALADDSIGSAKSSPGERAADHWTPEAVAKAAQAPTPNIDPASIKLPPGAERAAVNPGSMPSQVVEGATKNLERKAGNVNSVPLVFAGKMFFSKPDGDFMCSAQFISKNVLLTAAHCVRDDNTGDFWKNITFFLQYDKGRASAKYTQKCAATFNGWVQPGNEKYLSDYAMILVDEPSKTGWFGIEWDWEGKYKTATKIGYPVGIADGEVIQVLTGPISITDGIVELHHGDPNEQGGSSGGAWIGDYDTKGDPKHNHIISVESFGFDGKPGYDYGPYFNDRVKKLFDYVSNGCQ